MLRPLRQTEQVNIDYMCPFTQEEGGILTYGVASGLTIAQYAFSASGAVPIGIQMNNIEHQNLGREYFRQRWERMDVPCGIVGASFQGDYETDWIHAVGTIMPGDAAYVGPSGMFTNSTAFGGARVGKFLSTLQADSHVVTMRGLGYSRVFVDCFTKELTTENNPDDRVLVVSDGYIKVRVEV